MRSILDRVSPSLFFVAGQPAARLMGGLFVMASLGCAGSGLPGDPCLNPVAAPSCPDDTVADVDGACASRDDCVSPGDDCTGEPVLCVPIDGDAGRT